MKPQNNRKTAWITGIVTTALLAVTCSLVVYGELGKSTVSESSLTSGYSNVNPPNSVQSGGKTDNGVTFGGTAWGVLKVGYSGKNKETMDSSEVYIPRLGSDRYALIESNVTVKRTDESGKVIQTLEGKALVFSNQRDGSNAGYVMVSPTEARTWVSVLNGNPDYIFNPSKSNLYQYTIQEVRTGQTITAYNLAELADKSGGKGDPPPGDGLTRIRDDLYFKRDGFIATPQPKGDISVNKSQYEVGETVNISSWAEDYSSYDKGTFVKNLSVVNKETGEQWDYIVDNQELRKSAGGSTARSFAAAADQTQQPVSRAAKAPAAATATPVEFVNANMLPNTPYKTSQIPAAVAELPKTNQYLMIINNPPADVPRAGENFAAGRILQIGWDIATVALDAPEFKTDSPNQKGVAITGVVWDKLKVEKAFVQDGVNVVIVRMNESAPPTITYVDESGKPIGESEQLLLVFAQFGDPNKSLPLVFSRTSSEIYGVKKLEKEKATVIVGGKVGERTRGEGQRVFFRLDDMGDQELSVELKQ